MMTEKDLWFVEHVSDREKWRNDDLVRRLLIEVRAWRAGALRLATPDRTSDDR